MSAESTVGSSAPTQLSSTVIAVQPVESEWLTASEAAQYLKVKTRTLLLWVRQGKVKGFALSGTRRRVWRFRKQDLNAAMMENDVLPFTTPSVRPEERVKVQ